jgi:uncharacterized protein
MTRSVRLGDSYAAIDEAAWDRIAGTANPFVSHAFLSACETSDSATSQSGWQPLPLLLEDADGTLLGAMPLYGKSHSQGEYVFDHGWADAWHRAGGNYYPKLLCAAPFTPAPGPRLLGPPEVHAELIAGIEAMVAANRLSSAHANFLTDADCATFEDVDWLIRQGVQYHWLNKGYASFDDFLATLSSRKRRSIRKERLAAQGAVDAIVHLTGSDITEAHWDAFWIFYQDTGSRKWGRPYLTRKFFSIIGRTMADRIVLMLAMRDGKPIAGALNFLGSDTLYGRYWGCTIDVPFLHFELCYYQAIDAAIARGLARVEAGAQGEHKLARGYEPVPTWSAHYIEDPGFREAVSDFLRRERQAMEREIAFLGEMTPFRKGG